jgi:hypothetical protein
MSSGQHRKHIKFNPVVIRDGFVVRLNKNGTVKDILGKYGEYGKKSSVATQRG